MIYLSSKRRLEIELGKEALYRGQVGARIDGFYYGGPFVRVALYSDFLVISCNKFLTSFKKEDIFEFKIGKDFISEGLDIIHNKSGIPTDIRLYPYGQSGDLKETFDKVLFQGSAT